MLTVIFLILIYFAFQIIIWKAMKKLHDGNRPSIAEAASCIAASIILTILVYIYAF